MVIILIVFTCNISMLANIPKKTLLWIQIKFFAKSWRNLGVSCVFRRCVFGVIHEPQGTTPQDLRFSIMEREGIPTHREMATLQHVDKCHTFKMCGMLFFWKLIIWGSNLPNLHIHYRKSVMKPVARTNIYIGVVINLYRLQYIQYRYHISSLT